MDISDPVVVAVVLGDSEALVIKSLLDSYNIPSHYTSELPTRIYPVSADGIARIGIYVAAEHAQVAKEILEEHQRPQITDDAGED